MTKTIVAIGIACCLSATVAAQTPIDMSGVWAMDPSRSDAQGIYGQLRIVRQTANELDVAVVDYDPRGNVTVVPWKFRVNRWGPRRGPDSSSQPRTNARWLTDRKLVLVKAPGSIGAALWVWTISADGSELAIETVNPAVSWMSDLTRVAASERRYTHVFVKKRRTDPCRDCFFVMSEQRVTWDPAPAGDVAFRLDSDATTLEATCRVARCTRVDLYSGSRIGSRALRRDEVTNIRTSSEVIFEFKARPGVSQ